MSSVAPPFTTPPPPELQPHSFSPAMLKKETGIKEDVGTWGTAVDMMVGGHRGVADKEGAAYRGRLGGIDPSSKIQYNWFLSMKLWCGVVSRAVSFFASRALCLHVSLRIQFIIDYNMILVPVLQKLRNN